MLKKSLRTVQKYETGENGVSLRVDSRKGKDAVRLHEMLCGWRQAAAKLKAGGDHQRRIRPLALLLS